MSSKIPSPQSEELLNELNAGSPDALDSLAKDIHPQIARIVRAKKRSALKRTLDTDDLVQDVWATVLSRLDSLPRFKNRQEAIKYFSQIARRQVTKQRRRHFAEKRDTRRDVSLGSKVLPANGVTPSRELMAADRTFLSDIETKVLDLRLAGHSNIEIATILETNETKIRRILRRLACKMADGKD